MDVGNLLVVRLEMAGDLPPVFVPPAKLVPQALELGLQA